MEPNFDKKVQEEVARQLALARAQKKKQEVDAEKEGVKKKEGKMRDDDAPAKSGLKNVRISTVGSKKPEPTSQDIVPRSNIGGVTFVQKFSNQFSLETSAQFVAEDYTDKWSDYLFQLEDANLAFKIGRVLFLGAYKYNDSETETGYERIVRFTAPYANTTAAKRQRKLAQDFGACWKYMCDLNLVRDKYLSQSTLCLLMSKVFRSITTEHAALRTENGIWYIQDPKYLYSKVIVAECSLAFAIDLVRHVNNCTIRLMEDLGFSKAFYENSKLDELYNGLDLSNGTEADYDGAYPIFPWNLMHNWVIRRLKQMREKQMVVQVITRITLEFCCLVAEMGGHKLDVNPKKFSASCRPVYDIAQRFVRTCRAKHRGGSRARVVVVDEADMVEGLTDITELTAAEAYAALGRYAKKSGEKIEVYTVPTVDVNPPPKDREMATAQLKEVLGIAKTVEETRPSEKSETVATPPAKQGASAKPKSEDDYDDIQTLPDVEVAAEEEPKAETHGYPVLPENPIDAIFENRPPTLNNPELEASIIERIKKGADDLLVETATPGIYIYRQEIFGNRPVNETSNLSLPRKVNPTKDPIPYVFSRGFVSLVQAFFYLEGVLDYDRRRRYSENPFRLFKFSNETTMLATWEAQAAARQTELGPIAAERRGSTSFGMVDPPMTKHMRK